MARGWRDPIGPPGAAAHHRGDIPARRARRHHQGGDRRRQDDGLTPAAGSFRAGSSSGVITGQDRCVAESEREPAWREPPATLRPMLATAGVLPSGDAGWAYEMKWDGLRALAFVAGEAVRLASRTGRDI